MKKLWQKLTGTSAKSPPQREWIAICVKLSGGEYGSRQEQEEVRSFARKLEGAIEALKDAAYDGDEFGNHEASLYLYGQNADRLFESIESLLRSWEPLRGGHAIKRYGAPARSEHVQF